MERATLISVSPAATGRSPWRIPWLAVLALLLLVTPPAPLWAQQEAPAGTAPTADELESLVETLEDGEARARLVAELRALIAAERGLEAEEPAPVAGNIVLRLLSDRIESVGAAVAELDLEPGDLRRVGEWFARQADDPGRRRFWLGVLVQVGLAVGLGLLAARVTGFALKRPRLGLERRERPRLWSRLPLLAARTVLDLGPVAAFAVAAYATLAVAQPDERARLVMLAAINAVVIARAGVVAARLLFTPLAPSLRPFTLEDATAAYLFVWSRRLINLPVYGYYLGQAALVLGVPEGGYAIYIKLLGLLVTAMVLTLVMQNRSAVALSLRGSDVDRGAMNPVLRALRDRLAEFWHVLAAIYLVVIFGVWALEIAGGFLFVARGTAVTVAAAVVARVLVQLIRLGVGRAFRVSAEIRARFPHIERRADRYLAVVRYALEGVVWIVAALVALEAWRVDALSWLGGGFGQAFIGAVLDIVVVLAIAVVVWESSSAAVARFLEATDEEGEVVERSARVRTLLPLARRAVLVAVVTVSVLTILSTLGIEIAPLLAGAGVAGLAIGFGAQTLVKDIITGAFILFEDIIAVGDVATVAGHTGVIEEISVRTIQLRDYAGTVHLIPFSSVDTVTNLTKDFSYYVLNVGIAYREDVDEVIEVMREVLEELREDPGYAPDILEPLEVSGLDRFEDSAVVIRARIKTKPIRQWAVGREYNRRMKARFDELGIEIPFPHQTIYFGVDREGEAPPARVALEERGAATAARAEERPRARRERVPGPEDRTVAVPEEGGDGDGGGAL